MCGEFVYEFEVFLPVVREAVDLKYGKADEGCLDSNLFRGLFFYNRWFSAVNLDIFI